MNTALILRTPRCEMLPGRFLLSWHRVPKSEGCSFVIKALVKIGSTSKAHSPSQLNDLPAVAVLLSNQLLDFESR